jgi:hypothetical protein
MLRVDRILTEQKVHAGDAFDSTQRFLAEYRSDLDSKSNQE